MRQLSIGMKLTRRYTRSLHAITPRSYGGTIQKQAWSALPPCLRVNILLQYIVPQYMARFCAVTDPVPAVLVIVRSKHGPPYGILIPSTQGDHPHIRCTGIPSRINRTLPSHPVPRAIYYTTIPAHSKRGLITTSFFNPSFLYGTDPTVRRLTKVSIQSLPRTSL
jgi:hypothetical protein